MYTDHDDARPRHLFTDILRCVGPVQARHRDIEQNDIGSMQGSQLDRFIAVGALSYHIEFTASLQKGPQAATDKRMIVDDEHASCSHVFSIRRPGDIGRRYPVLRSFGL